MLTLISPAKTLDFETPAVTEVYTQGEFLEHSAELIDQLKSQSPDDISALMKLSSKLSELNVQRFHDWCLPFDKDNAKAAVLAFKGDVYTGLDAESFTEEHFSYAQSHLGILSGLYGLLRPLDLIQPYRLEMGTKFANSRGANLYTFWGTIITDAINQRLELSNSKVLINLASNEYFKAVKTKQLKAELITPVFKDEKKGQYKIISFYAKKARGLMAAYIVKNKVSTIQQLCEFDIAGYRFVAAESDAQTLTFKRSEQDLANA
ncbi:MAG: peroxide stress protein YaaA [Oleispira antarctica]|nr:peroxide stress protein YaaA [Oleispira antarctica]MBQ0793561.1 peroxide stress protein YaaA [Oleispira antarctica]